MEILKIFQGPFSSQ